MHYAILQQFKKTLAQVDTWLDAATKNAELRAFDPNVLVTMRLAPDQFAFARQVQITCDTAKLAASRLTGRDAPKQEDNESTIAELRARVRSVLDYLQTFSAKDFEGAGARTVTQPRWEGKVMSGDDYLLEHALPNFYFHASHVYAILRHAGVPVGKRDFLGALSLRSP